MEQISEEAFHIEANVQLSLTFYAWLFEAGAKVKIIEPNAVVEEYINLLKEIIEEYT